MELGSEVVIGLFDFFDHWKPDHHPDPIFGRWSGSAAGAGPV